MGVSARHRLIFCTQPLESGRGPASLRSQRVVTDLALAAGAFPCASLFPANTWGLHISIAGARNPPVACTSHGDVDMRRLPLDRSAAHLLCSLRGRPPNGTCRARQRPAS